MRNRLQPALKIVKFRICTAFFFMLCSFHAVAQSDDGAGWQFGGGIGLGIGGGYTDIMLAPSAIYNFNRYVAAGVGVQGSYVRVKSDYESYMYGGSLITLFAPIEQLQLSVEVEQLRVNTRFAPYSPFYPYAARVDRSDNFWNTALFLGAGYRVQNVTLGVRYNVLYDANRSVYGDAFMPFIRAYF